MIQVFIYDSNVCIINNKKFIEKKLKNIIEGGRIINKIKFIDNFLKILKEEKVKSKFFGDNISIILNTFYQESDQNFLEHMFLEMGFLKVIFYNIKELFINDLATYIEINDSYIVINLDSGVYLSLKYIKDINLILDYFSEYMKNDVYLFGSNKNIPKVLINGKNVYYYEDCKNFIVNSLLRENNCDV